MADTGSEALEGAERTATHVAERLLERQLMLRRMERTAQAPREVDRSADPAEVDHACVLEVRPPEGCALDLRAHEVLDALERAGSAAAFHVDDDGGRIVLSVPTGSLEPTQRALERLQADAHSGFTLAEVEGLDALERATGHRTLEPRATDRQTAAHRPGHAERLDRDEPRDARAEAEAETDVTPEEGPDEERDLVHAIVNFASHPDEADADRKSAERFTERMRERGIDAHTGRPHDDGSRVVALTYPTSDEERVLTECVNILREIGDVADEVVMVVLGEDPECDPTDAAAYTQAMADRGYDPWHAAMGGARGVRQTIEISYPSTERARFAADHAEVSHALGIEPELDVLKAPMLHPRTLEELVDERLAELEREAPAIGPELGQDATPAMDAADYLALAPARRALVPADRIPDAAFGGRVAEAARRAREASRLLEAERAPERVAERTPERVAETAVPGRA